MTGIRTVLDGYQGVIGSSTGQDPLFQLFEVGEVSFVVHSVFCFDQNEFSLKHITFLVKLLRPQFCSLHFFLHLKSLFDSILELLYFFAQLHDLIFSLSFFMKYCFITFQGNGVFVGRLLFDSGGFDHFQLFAKFWEHSFGLSVLLLTLGSSTEEGSHNILIFAEQYVIKFSIFCDFHSEAVVEIFKLEALPSLFTEIIVEGFISRFQIFVNFLKPTDIFSVVHLFVFVGGD